MIRTNTRDEFYDLQPQVDLFGEYEKYDIPSVIFDEEKKSPFNICPKGLYIDKGEFENDQLLETSWYDFKLFCDKNKLGGKEYKISLVVEEGYEKQQYDIEILEDCTIITVGEREGVRRALIKFQDLLIVGGGNILLGKTRYKTPIERIMSRCFFAPIGRPPKFKEELGDDEDYYSDAYLNRFMRTGVNTIWVYTDFDRLLKSPYITEFGADSEKHLKKLNEITEKCERYGIEVFTYLIAPLSLYEPHIANRYIGIADKYPQTKGNSHVGPPAFCIYTEFGEKYLRDAVERFMNAVPKIKGILNVSHGERVTSCGNSWPDLEGKWYNNCPHCGDKSRMEIITRMIEIFVESMKKVNPDSVFIAWTYAHRDVPREEIREYFERLPKDVITMEGFEDDAIAEQLGRERYALDYWLSYAGPSQMYEFAAKNAQILGKRIYSKMQICCSHELATVPYIPAPGIIYDKMTTSKLLGSTGVLEGWYFGTCPSLMTRAVGLLSTDKVYANKREFLVELANLYYAKEDVEIVVDAWEFFEKSYQNYPLNVLFSYYGPMHDGVVWELALKPKNFSLPRSWQLTDKPDGDRLGESLFMGHTDKECLILTERMTEFWEKGLEKLSKTSVWGKDYDEQISVAKTLGILLKSGRNIVKFYKLRNDLGYGRGDAKTILAEMKQLVLLEKQNSLDMIPLCEKDVRLGYHSEAEGHKFFPAKLRHRIGFLDKLLQTEFVEVEKRIDDNLSPLEYYDGVEEGINSIKAGRNGLESAEWGYLDDGVSKFRIAVGDYIEIEVKSDKKENFYFVNEFELFFPDASMMIMHEGRVTFHRDANTHQSLRYERQKREKGKWTVECHSTENTTHVIARIKKEDTRFVGFPYKFMIRSWCGKNWCKDPLPVRALGKSLTSPADFGWVK